MESYLPLVEYPLPDFIVSYYELLKVEPVSNVLHIYLQEKNYEESELSRTYYRKVFCRKLPFRTFPFELKGVFLHIKRRRWLNTTTGKVQQRNWNQVGQGTRMTEEFARPAAQRSIDETSLSDGELYTILTNKAAQGRCRSIILLIAGTKAETVIEILRKTSLKTRKKVSEITLYMAGTAAGMYSTKKPQIGQKTTNKGTDCSLSAMLT